MIRLNKLLADRGLGARRKCDEMIQSGAVHVNGALVTEPGTQVDPQRDRVDVNGRPLPRATAQRTYMLHKPVGVISTLSDPEGRRSLREFMPPGARLFPVGRLDADTSGLLLLTNDGDLAHHLMHPRYGVAKRYRVHLDRAPSEAQLARLRDGVEFEPGVTSSPAEVWTRDASGDEAVIEIAIHEGRHRQVRRMCEAMGLEVRRLHRYGYGPLKLGELARGMWRELSDEEIAELRASSARPAAPAGGFTGRRSFDRPRVRPRRDRIGGAPGSAAARSAGGEERAGFRRGERGGRSDDRAGRERDERDSRREGSWSRPETGVWRSDDVNAAAPWPEPKQRPARGAGRSGNRSRTPERSGPRMGGERFRPERGARPMRGGERGGERPRRPLPGGRPAGDRVRSTGARPFADRSRPAGNRARSTGGRPFTDRGRPRPFTDRGGVARDSRGAPGARSFERPRPRAGAADRPRGRDRFGSERSRGFDRRPGTEERRGPGRRPPPDRSREGFERGRAGRSGARTGRPGGPRPERGGFRPRGERGGAGRGPSRGSSPTRRPRPASRSGPRSRPFRSPNS